MKKHLLFLSLLFVTLVFFNACQKEVSTETGGAISQGSLQLDAGTGECLPKKVEGIYEVNKPLDGTKNYIDVQVNVTQAGAYLIFTDTANGIFFRSSGIFTGTGMNTVRLKGSGTPLEARIDNFLVIYGTTFCEVAVTTVPVGGGTPAVFTLAGAPAECTGAAASVSGNYIVGVALTSANTAVLNVNVTTTGIYSITTPVSNGITFSGSGSLTATGARTITLAASGTPVTAGSTQIAVPNGAGPGSNCNFAVTVTAATVPVGDYFPLTANSWWSYDDDEGIFVGGDSLTRLNINPISLSGNTYRIFQNQDETDPMDSCFFRKVGTEYREINVADFYSFAITFDGFVPGEIPFLKEGLATNTTWESQEFSGTMSSVPVKLKYVFKCTNANATFTVNGNTFNNVYKISWNVKHNIASTGYMDDPWSFESYYAPGVGLVYFKLTDPGGSSDINIQHWKVF